MCCKICCSSCIVFSEKRNTPHKKKNKLQREELRFSPSDSGHPASQKAHCRAFPMDFLSVSFGTFYINIPLKMTKGSFTFKQGVSLAFILRHSSEEYLCIWLRSPSLGRNHTYFQNYFNSSVSKCRRRK